MAGFFGINSISAFSKTPNPYSIPNQESNRNRNNTRGIINAQNTVLSNVNKKKAQAFPMLDNYVNDIKNQKMQKGIELRNMLRDLNRPQEKNENPYVVSSDSLEEFLKLSGAPKEDEKNKKVSDYNYKDVANKIQQAKNSTSAGQAVLAAKRNVLDVKKKIAQGKGDPEELQLALSHAKRMEMTARKKMHHLELEEMVAATGNRDERMDKEEEAVNRIKQAMVEASEQEVSKQEDAIFEARQKMIEEVKESIEEKRIEASEEELASLNEMISEFGEDQLKMLEEIMEMLECMEIVDPHMDKEDLEELKKKHRLSEEKEIVKANMEYLKGLFKLMSDKGGSVQKMDTQTLGAVPAPAPVSTPTPVSVAVQTSDISISP